MLYATRLSALLSGGQSMQDCVCGNISGAVMPNRKLSVILNRQRNNEGSYVNGREKKSVWYCQ